MTPVFVRVKKPSSIACRCSNSFTRRSPVTLLPTVEVNHVCTTPSAAESRKSPIMMSDEAQQQVEVGRAAVDREQCVVEDALHDQRRDHGDRGAERSPGRR